MTQPKAVLFDCDGVLVDSERLTNQVLRDDLAGRGLDWPLDRLIDLFVGGTMAGVEQQARALGADIPPGWLDYIYAQIFSVLDREVKLVPGVDLLLDHLDAAGIPYAVGSNGPVAKMEVTLRRTGLIDRFAGRYLSAHDCPAAKPEPDVYLKAAQVLGVAPTDCIVIEDSENGARAAVAAQMPCFGYVRDTPRDRLAPHCTVLFTDMADVAALLNL